MTETEAGLSLLQSLPRYAVGGAAALKPGLERVRALLEALGNPHLSYPVVHVAGTNGKGSTASMIAAIASAAGYRTGLHTSPHLLDVNERIRVDSVPAPRTWLAGAALRLEALFETVRPSFFEATVALTFEWFRLADVDLAVIETGLGGRLDATNVVIPCLSVITDLSIDHAEILGASLPLIAREKAGIIKRGVPVVAMDSGDEANAVLVEVARDLGSSLEIVSRFPHRVLDLAGAHQLRNAALAVAAARKLAGSAAGFDRIDASAVEDGLRRTRELTGLRARFEILNRRPLVALDVAHNPDGLRAALAAFDDATLGAGRSGDRVLCFAVMADKDPVAMASMIAATGIPVLPVRLEPGRALEPKRLADTLTAAGVRLLGPVQDPSSLPGWLALNLGPDDSALVAGSFYLAGPFLEAWSSGRFRTTVSG